MCMILCNNSLYFSSSQTGQHLHHAPNDAVWSWFAPDRPAGENVNASCSDWRQHVGEGIIMSWILFVFVLCLCHNTATNMSNLGCLSQCCSALFVGDRNVSLLRHRYVPSDTAPLGGIHRQHRGGPVFAQTPGTVVFTSLTCQLTSSQKKSQPCVCVSEMCCGCSRPAGSDSASCCSREGRGGGVLDAAAENKVQDAPWEEPQRPHATGPLQTGENIQVNAVISKTQPGMLTSLRTFKYLVCLHFSVSFSFSDPDVV